MKIGSMYAFIDPVSLNMGTSGQKSDLIANRMEGCGVGQLFLAPFNQV